MCRRSMRRRWSTIDSSATSSSPISSHADCGHRARRNAGAATRAGRGIDLGHGRPAKARAEADRAHRARIAADPALHALPSQARLSNLRLDRPGARPIFVTPQRAVPAGSGASTAKRTFAPFEVHLGIAAHHDDDLRRTRRHAIAAARTGGDERRLGQRPGRTLRRAAGLEITPHELSATDHQLYLPEVPGNGFCPLTACRATRCATAVPQPISKNPSPAG